MNSLYPTHSSTNLNRHLWSMCPYFPQLFSFDLWNIPQPHVWGSIWFWTEITLVWWEQGKLQIFLSLNVNIIQQAWIHKGWLNKKLKRTCRLRTTTTTIPTKSCTLVNIVYYLTNSPLVPRIMTKKLYIKGGVSNSDLYCKGESIQREGWRVFVSWFRGWNQE